MNLLLIGDLHLRLSNPKNRIDDYWEAFKRKMSYAYSIYKSNDCSYLIQPGDFFDSHKANSQTKAEAILLLQKLNEPKIITVFGQHDLKHHSQQENTPIAVLSAANLIKPLYNTSYKIADSVYLYGASWGEEFPEIENERALNILVTHTFVTEEPEIGIEKYATTNNLFSSTKFDLIVSGDNHKSFMIKKKERCIVNCGSLMRSSISQIDHQPCVYVYNTDGKKLKKFLIPIEDFDKVMDIKYEQEIRDKNRSLDLLIDTISKKLHIEGLNYNENVKSGLSELSEGTNKKVRKAMGWKE